MQKNYEIKRRFVLDADGSHIAISKTIADIVTQALTEAEVPFSVRPADGWVMVSLPPDGDTDGLAQLVHDAETGASIPVSRKWEGEIAAIWARIYNDRTEDAMEMCRLLTSQKQRDRALAELRDDV